MNILIIGSGGREHALAYACRRDGHGVTLWPGSNAMTDVDIVKNGDMADHKAMVAYCREKAVDLVIVGPERPLADGLADHLRKAGIVVFGPGKDGARWESSKAYSKEMMQKYAIPTAKAAAYETTAQAIEAVMRADLPLVVKKDGLAAGKGVWILREAEERDVWAAKVKEMPDDRFIVEEYLNGPEVSVLVMTDGTRFLRLPTMRDYKRLNDGQEGPNTGGMGAIGPVALDEQTDRAIDAIIEKTLSAMRAEGTDYRGVLYLGLMLTDRGPKVLEYNVRFGDPETEPLILLLQNDFAQMAYEAATGALKTENCAVREGKALCVIVASKNYPYGPSSAEKITALPEQEGIVVFHAGTERKEDGLYAVGGRVLAICTVGDSWASARRSIYDYLQTVHFNGAKYRHDIGEEA